MKFLKYKVFFFLLLMISSSQAQEFKLGKVTVEELQEKHHPIDTSAVAAILYKKSRIFFTYKEKAGFSLNNEVTYRIKIYKKEGLDWANFEVPYYIGYENLNDDYLSFQDAVTYNIENENIVKTKLDSEGSFKTKTNENWKKATISMPNVTVGSIVQFSYVLKSENLVKLPVFDFQYSIPVNYAEYKTEIPEYFIYKTILKGYVEIQNDSKLVSGSSNFENQYSQMQILTYDQINSTYIVKKVPSIIEEEFIDNFRNYEGSIHNELERTRFPDYPVKDYAVTWEGVAKTIFEHKDFGNQLLERDYLIKDLNLILHNIESKEERLNVIFKFVQEKMNWNQEYGYYTDKGVIKAYESRMGNIAEINFILISMLKLAGIPAYPVLVSTIEHGIPVYPSRTNFNYVVAMAEVEGKQIVLDATHTYTTQNILPLNALNWKGRLIKSDGTSSEVDLIPNTPSMAFYSLAVKVNPEAQVSGELKSRMSNYEAYKFRDRYAEINTDNYIEKLENLYNGIEISNYKIENKSTDLLKPVDENFSFRSNNLTEVIGGKIFLNPMLFFTMYKNPFVQEKRKMPIYFGYPVTKKYYINIEIPEGYEVESIPKGVNLSTDDGSLVFIYAIEKKENKIQIIVQSESKNAIVSAENYQMLKDFYKKIVDIQQEKIVLKKI